MSIMPCNGNQNLHLMLPPDMAEVEGECRVIQEPPEDGQIEIYPYRIVNKAWNVAMRGEVEGALFLGDHALEFVERQLSVNSPTVDPEFPDQWRRIRYQMIVKCAFNRAMSQVEPKPKNPDLSVIYFVLDSANNIVKVGTTSNLEQRLNQLKSANPYLVLLKTIEGGRKKEMSLHSRFAKLRVSGEWFKYENPLKSFIKKLPD